MESQTSVSKRAPREFRNWRVQGNPLTLRQPFANPSPTPRQPFANPLPTFSANLFCQPLSNPLFPWTPGTRLETLVKAFLGMAIFKSFKGLQFQLSGVWRISLHYSYSFLVLFAECSNRNKFPSWLFKKLLQLQLHDFKGFSMFNCNEFEKNGASSKSNIAKTLHGSEAFAPKVGQKNTEVTASISDMDLCRIAVKYLVL